jgi:hypothetical protein
MARTLVIGDIHGCIDELRDLLDLAGLGEDDEIISLGDMVDRGPDSAGVARFFRDHPRGSALRGNHEQKHVLSRRGRLQPSLSQNIVRRELGEETHAQLCAWFSALPLYIERPDALLLHGFVEPGVPLPQQQPQVLMGTMSGERHLQQTLDRPWYELIDHPTPIIVGHRDYRRDGQPLVYRDRVFGLDTTVYSGGRLTGLLLPEFRILSVPARGDHWAAVRSCNADLRYTQTPPETLTWRKAREILAAYRQHPPCSERHRRRQQRISAMLHAAEQVCAGLIGDFDQIAALPEPQRQLRIQQHPQRALLERHTRGRPLTPAALERHFKRPSQALCRRRHIC